jgi:hypothetical protein
MLDIGSVIAYAQANPLNVMMLLFILYRVWQSQQPFPETGGRVKTISSMADWTATLAKAVRHRRLTVGAAGGVQVGRGGGDLAGQLLLLAPLPPLRPTRLLPRHGALPFADCYAALPTGS